MKVSKKALVAVQGASGFIAGFIALAWYEQQVLKQTTKATLLIYDIASPEEVEASVFESIKKLAEIRKWENIVFLNGGAMRELSLKNYSKSKSELKKRVGSDHFDHIFLANNYASFGSKLIPATYSTAESIEFGDSFGVVGNGHIKEITWAKLFKETILTLKILIRKLVFNQFPKEHVFDRSILILPIDFRGNYLDDKTLLVPSQEFVKDVFVKLSGLLPDLLAYCEHFMANGTNHQLYLLSNLANSGLTTFEKEVELYVKVIRETALLGSTILIKNHPRGSISVIKAVFEAIKDNYDVQIADDRILALYPIELWSPILMNATIIPIYSNSSINIPYIYSKKIKLSLTEEKIKTFIFPDNVGYILKSTTIFSDINKKLADWDQKSVIWTKE